MGDDGGDASGGTGMLRLLLEVAALMPTILIMTVTVVIALPLALPLVILVVPVLLHGLA